MASRTIASSAIILAASAVILLVSNIPAAAARGAARRAGPICAKTAYPTLCTSVIGDLKNPIQATQATITYLLTKTKEAQVSSAQYKDNNSAINVCHITFANAVYNLQQALNSVKTRNKAALNVNLTGAVSDFGACVDAFIESGQINFLQNAADALRKTGSNCLTLSTLIR